MLLFFDMSTFGMESLDCVTALRPGARCGSAEECTKHVNLSCLNESAVLQLPSAVWRYLWSFLDPSDVCSASAVCLEFFHLGNDGTSICTTLSHAWLGLLNSFV